MNSSFRISPSASSSRITRKFVPPKSSAKYLPSSVPFGSSGMYVFSICNDEICSWRPFDISCWKASPTRRIWSLLRIKFLSDSFTCEREWDEVRMEIFKHKTFFFGCCWAKKRVNIWECEENFFLFLPFHWFFSSGFFASHSQNTTIMRGVFFFSLHVYLFTLRVKITDGTKVHRGGIKIKTSTKNKIRIHFVVSFRVSRAHFSAILSRIIMIIQHRLLCAIRIKFNFSSHACFKGLENHYQSS